METKLDLSKLNIKDPVAPKVANPSESPVKVLDPEQPVAPSVPVVKYQHYKSSRISMRMITPTGGRITFTGYEFITRDKDIIDFLDEEISKGLREVTKGELLTKESIWVKRPGTGKIKAKDYTNIMGKKATKNLKKNIQLDWDMID